jgi:hypothetical protein
MKLKDVPDCKGNWDTCERKYACEHGEDCWFESEDYRKAMEAM